MARVEEGLQLLLLDRCFVSLRFFFALNYTPPLHTYILIIEGHFLKIVTIP